MCLDLPSTDDNKSRIQNQICKGALLPEKYSDGPANRAPPNHLQVRPTRRRRLNRQGLYRRRAPSRVPSQQLHVCASEHHRPIHPRAAISTFDPAPRKLYHAVTTATSSRGPRVAVDLPYFPQGKPRSVWTAVESTPIEALRPLHSSAERGEGRFSG